jgi:hypothetical protein
MLRDGASAADARSRQHMYAADAYTKQRGCKSSFCSAIPQQWRGASALESTLRRNAGGNRRGGMVTTTATTRTKKTMHSNYINIKNHIICLFICNSCCAAEATQWHANPWIGAALEIFLA